MACSIVMLHGKSIWNPVLLVVINSDLVIDTNSPRNASSLKSGLQYGHTDQSYDDME